MLIRFLGMSSLLYIKCWLCTEAHVEIVCVSPEGSSGSLLSCKGHREGAKLISRVLGHNTGVSHTFPCMASCLSFYCNILSQLMPQSVKSIFFHLLWLYRLLLPSTYLFAYTSLQSRGSNNSLLERENSIPLVQPCYHLLSYSILHTLILCH